MATGNNQNFPPIKTISDFKSTLTGGGARSNLFEVELSFPAGAPISDPDGVIEKSRFLVKSAALPASQVLHYQFHLEEEY